MLSNRIVSAVSRMPFSGIRYVRPAALRGALAARHGDEATVTQSCDRIKEVRQTNIVFATMGGIALAANTYFAFKSASPLDCAAHAAEAGIGGLMLVGHSMSAYAQRVIIDKVQGIAAQVPVAESTPPQTYPEFATPAPAGSGLVELVAMGGVAGIFHPVIELMSQYLR